MIDTRALAAGVLADVALHGMSLRERVGQLLMVDCPTSGLSSATEQAVTAYHVGSVILDGTSYAGWAAATAVVATAEEAFLRGALFGALQRWRGNDGTDNIDACSAHIVEVDGVSAKAAKQQHSDKRLE